MYAQLGNIVFKGLYSFTDLSFDGDEANFAQFDLINRKAALQFTGMGLVEVSATIMMNAEFCNINQQIQALKKAKEAAEVLPLLMGNGTYLGDFVIVSNSFNVQEALADGTYKQITMQLVLKEFVSIDKLAQKNLSAVKNGIAVGDKKAAVLLPGQKVTLSKDVAISITATKQQAKKVIDSTSVLQTPPNPITADSILNSAKNGKQSVTSLINKLNNNLTVLNNGPSIKQAAELVLSSFNATISNYPFTNVANTLGVTEALRQNTASLSKASTVLLQKVILR